MAFRDQRVFLEGKSWHKLLKEERDKARLIRLMLPLQLVISEICIFPLFYRSRKKGSVNVLSYWTLGNDRAKF